MRIKIKNSVKFFDALLLEDNLNLKQLSEGLSLQYSALKKYRTSKRTIPEEVFKRIISTYSIDNIKIDFVYLEDTWGQTKGGRNTIKKLGKNGLSKHLTFVRGFKRITKVKLRLNKFFCEFWGALMGDGCISRFKDFEGTERLQIIISGNKRLDSNYMKYLKVQLLKEYSLYSYYYEYKKENVCRLVIRNKDLALQLIKLGFPSGRKYEKLKIPNKFLALDWNYKKLVIRGLFDTDGSIYSRKDEGYKYPIISIKSISSKLLQQLFNLLRSSGYPAYISGNNVAVRGNKNIKKWFEDIGSSNLRNKLKYQYWLKNKVLPPKAISPGLVVHR